MSFMECQPFNESILILGRFLTLKKEFVMFSKRLFSVVALGILGGFWGVSEKAAAWELQYAPIMTPWAQLVDTNAPLPEYPRPQMVRSNWMNLNGIWEFREGSASDAVPTNTQLPVEILVPFPMESAISGVAEYHAWSWYRRTFKVPAAWSGQRVLLHLDAVTWQSQVFVNGQSVGIHKGGYDPVTYDITAYLTNGGDQELIVKVYSPEDNGGQPRGKQSLYPGGIMYTSSSGIWQPVWLEPVPATSIASIHMVPDVDGEQLKLTVDISGSLEDVTVNAVARSGTSVVGSASGTPSKEMTISIPKPTLWCPTNPFLYDLDITLLKAATPVDEVTSYFGMRKISLGTQDGFLKMLLNNEFVFEFGPLDQGFWPDGVYTAPTDDALKSDIELEKAFGFNMVRKHIKVERARWYYWADKLGILVWQDMPSCNSYTSSSSIPRVDPVQFAAELTSMVRNCWNSPSIIMWDIFNEAQGQESTSSGVGQASTASYVTLVRNLDPSRLINQASGGNYFGVGDVFDNHNYPAPGNPTSSTQAVVDGEYGGVALTIPNHIWTSGGGEGSATDASDLMNQFDLYASQLSTYGASSGLSAAVYTQTTDVESELNGLFTYDRKVRKPDLLRIKKAVLKAALPPPVLTTVVPSSKSTSQTWRYTFNKPASNWYSTNFSDAAWSAGMGGFGTSVPGDAVVRTTWNTSDVWLRRSFNPGALTAETISNLVFYCYHDEDVQIYINGVLAGSASGYVTAYTALEMTDAGKQAILSNASNLLAVHCSQTSGGQYIDVGISWESNSVVSLPVSSVPSTPINLVCAYGSLGVSIGWSSIPNATSYNVKRSTVSGGTYSTVVGAAPLNCAVDASVSKGTTYFYVVSAVNESGESADSSEISITIPEGSTTGSCSLVTWFKADVLSGLVNGGNVSKWIDSSGNDNNATQTVLSQCPKFYANTMNKQPGVHFTSESQSYLAFPRPVKNSFTIQCVFQSSQGLNSGTLYYEGAGLINGEVSSVVNDFGTCLFANGSICAGTGNPDVAVVSGSGFNDGKPHLFTFTRDVGTGLVCLYVDGVQTGTTTGGVQSLTAPPQLVLGAQQTMLYYLSGDIGEIAIYNGVLDDLTRVSTEGALKGKFGILGGTSPGIPQGVLVESMGDSALISWNPVMGASSYQLYWSTNASGPFILVADNITSNSYTNSVTIGGVTNYYTVASSNAAGISSQSDAKSLLPSIPSISAVLEGNMIHVSWPSWAGDWKLYSVDRLDEPINWIQVTNDVTAKGDTYFIEAPVDSETRYFRLAKP